MNLIDQVAQSHTPLWVENDTDGHLSYLHNTADCAAVIARSPLRYVLADSLTRLCADLAYSRGAGTVACADLLHVPAESLWVEWCNDPWQHALQHYGFPATAPGAEGSGRRGAWIRASRDGRRGLVRTFWSVPAGEVLASSVEAYFDFDTDMNEEPEPIDGFAGLARRVYDSERPEDILGRCFRFRYESSWAEYYDRAQLAGEAGAAVWRHALGTIAMDIPMLLTFLLLLATRNGLPQQIHSCEDLNRRRLSRGKPPLLPHIEVRAPLLPDYRQRSGGGPGISRTSPRLHHVRGHLVRRGSQIFWRVPHLRGSARAGSVLTRTVTWTFDRARGVPVH